MYLLQISFIAGMLLNLSCSSLGSESQKKDDATLRELIHDWPGYFVEHLNGNKAFSEGWALTSTGSYENGGQVIIFWNKTTNQAELHQADKGDLKLGSVSIVPQKDWAGFLAVLKKADKLGNLEIPSFDGPRYEYRHLKKDPKGMLQQVHKFEADNPDADPKNSKAHLEMFKNLHELAGVK